MNVEFPDVPEALTYGADREEALQHATDALLTAFMIYQDDRKSFPVPASHGEDFIALPIMASLKVLLHNAMIEKGVRKVDLARMTGWANPQIERILDPRHQSKVNLIEEALRHLGKGIVGKTVDL
ncbi:type II toxin-antitoxin system HicB family antitoxin [Paludibacterium denitrificans]|uniref:Type II toxin-antitoxin system HicB family antitoxin n=1 Tax=Paludibacterium denitrificans TaxID=2675226 RepID=A0A844GCZ1_9NEIS|nr:type II toxin-antitoxin system HicB family antitoxin [Paludibacterium denitrificans]MTD32634.1 type II toxin-antitoxin system HicB family antitoxin [Paludibacterium denitrificans]MTD34101.1 type II toxin-antitoxin system HicB family antitoxin [Paludibacterium denitrificans]